jgi:hypothetical protein
MSGRRTVEQWRAEVARSPRLSNAARVLLLVLADHMDAKRRVSVPRSRLARQIGRHPQRVAERIKQAREAGLLDVVSPGYRGHTAVYVGLFPDAEARKRTEPQYAKGPRDRYALAPDCVPHGQYTTTTADPFLAGADRHVGSEEEPTTGDAVNVRQPAARGRDDNQESA